MQPQHENCLIEGPTGALEALLETPAKGALKGCAVVCHPHPLHGGSMQNKVAHTLARSFIGAGFAALRFNFRGVGDSAGQFDEGEGEVADVLAAAAWTKARFGELPFWLAGFSFGAAMAIRAAVEERPAGLISVAPAVSRFMGSDRRQPDCPWLIVQGDADELVDIEETMAWVNTLDPGPEFVVIAQAEHFFHGKLVRLRETCQAFILEHSAVEGPESRGP